MKTIRSLETRFLAVLRPYLSANDRSDPPAPPILVAVSGGLDSSALLRLALATSKEHGREIIVGHVNHGVRPDASAEEARLRAHCREIGVAFRCARLRGVRSHGAQAPPSPPSEETLRRARVAALRRMASSSGCGWILLGHQRDDQAETFLLNLARGAGLRGLAGMPERRGIFLRPLLAFPREALRAYMESAGAAWVEDPTNLDLTIARNRIRHRILPLLEAELRPRVARAIARAAGHLQRALAALDEQAEACLAACTLPSGEDDIRLDPVRLRSYHRGLIEFTLRHAIARVRGCTTDIPASLSSAIVDHCIGGRAGVFPLPGGATVEASDRAIRVGRNRSGSGAGGPGPGWRGERPGSAEPIGGRSVVLPEALTIPPAGTVSWGAGRIRSSVVEPGDATRLRLRGLERLQVFDMGEVRFPVTLRAPRVGDRLRMEDGQGSRKLSDLLSERGVPRPLRAGQPVLEDAEGILWVPGIRRAARAFVGAGSSGVWVVRWFGRLPSEAALKGGATRG
jgi:tRNA(Ile)-lysidine synthase